MCSLLDYPVDSCDNNTFSLVHQNIRSIAKNIDEFDLYLGETDTVFDYIILTETWLIQDINFFSKNGYVTIYNEGDINKNDGVVVYIRENSNYVTNIIHIDKCKAIETQINTRNRKKLIITALYRPPSTNVILFLDQLKLYLEQSRQKTSDYHIIVGDMNINIGLEDDEIVSEYLNILSENNFESMINKDTRVQGKSASCIDHIFLKCKTPEFKEKCRPIIVHSHITDHYTQILKMPIESEPTQASIESYVEYIDYKNLRSELCEYDWCTFYEMRDIEMATPFFIERICKLTEKYTKRIKRKKDDKKRKEWVTKALMKSITTKNQLYKKYRENPEAYGEEFRNYRNRLNRVMEITKLNYYKSKIEKNKKSSKQLWNTINSIECKKKKSTIKEIIINNDVLTDNLKIANAFNKHYAEVGKKLASSIQKPITIPPSRKYLPKSMFLSPVDEKEICQIINSLKSKKSPGIDKIKSETLKEIQKEIAKPMTYLINEMMKSGVYPSILKVAVIKPLYKKGKKCVIENYRPISLISNVAKIFEKALKNRLNGYINKNNLLSKKQFGFREGKSTQDAIINLTSQIYKAIDNGRPSLCVFLDLSKAFDTVSHKQLLETLEDIGVRGTTYNLLESYLYQRKQFVQVENEMSSEELVQFGVPQGTVLGPLLFSIYLNNLLNLNTTGTIISFADDTVIVYEDNNWHDLKEKVESDMPHIIEWFNHQLLTINYEKTKFMTFTAYRNHLPNFNTLDIRDNELIINVSRTDTIKYLGVIIDSHMRWDVHTENVTKTLRSMLFKFKYLSKLLDIHQLRIIYFALVESRIQYAILSWGGVAAAHLRKLETIQKRILKIMYGKEPTFPSNLLFSLAKICDVRQTFLYNILTHIHKNKYLLNNIDHEHFTRQKKEHHVKTSLSSTKIGQRNISYLIPKIFNFLPSEQKINIININSRYMLKKKLKNYVLNLNRDLVRSLID